MRILLIAPASGEWRGIAKHRLFNGKTFRFSMLSLLSVAALSPKEASVQIVDEQVEDVPDESFDLVGITAMTAVAPRAYALCDRFRARGIPVVMGGFHASANPDEALQHADAVVVGPAYGAWEQVCADVQQKCLKSVYHGSLENKTPVTLPRHLVCKPQYVTISATFATLGCRNKCKFCSIHPFYEGARFTRDVEDVAAEIRAFDQRFFVFIDDNLTQDREYALALFKALAPLKKRWVTQVSIDSTEDEELMDAMQCAGCLGVFVGLETFNAEALEGQEKGFNSPQRYKKAVAALHRRGLFVEAGMIVGFDADGKEVFHDTLRMLDEIGIDAIQLSVLTPLPGTALHDEMKDRIIDNDWGHYDYRHVVFQPGKMSVQNLQDGADWLIRAFYTPGRMLRRLVRWVAMPGGWKHFIYPLGLNLAYYGRTRRFAIRGCDPAKEVSLGKIEHRYVKEVFQTRA